MCVLECVCASVYVCECVCVMVVRVHAGTIVEELH